MIVSMAYKFPLESLDADWCDFDDYTLSEESAHERCKHIPMKLKIQFVAAPNAAPFVRIVRELISVGYTKETMSMLP